jgi:hypothetical protein
MTRGIVSAVAAEKISYLGASMSSRTIVKRNFNKYEACPAQRLRDKLGWG